MNAFHPALRPRPARSAPRRRRPPAPARIALAAALVLGVAGCTPPWDDSDGKASGKVPCGLVVDGSGSGLSDKKGVDVKKKLQDTLVPFLEQQDCASLAYAPVTVSSQTSSCRESTVDLDPKPQSDTDDRDVLRQRARITAINTAVRMLECARTQNGSDVLGSLTRIAQAVSSGQDGAKGGSKGGASILAVTDFDQADKEFHLSRQPLDTAAQRTQAVEKLLKGRQLPALQGMDLYTVGYGKNPNRKPSAYQGFDLFWTDILTTRAKAHVHHDYE